MIIISLLSLIVFVFIIYFYYKDKLIIDEWFYNKLKKMIREPFISIFKVITIFGSILFYVLFLFILLFIIKFDVKFWILAVGMSLCGILNRVLKEIFKRERPNKRRIVTEKGYSLPSGHSMSSMIFYVLLYFVFFQNNMYVLAFFIVLVILIGFSRILLGVHYLSDVLAGFSFGLFYVLMYSEIVKIVISYF